MCVLIWVYFLCFFFKCEQPWSYDSRRSLELGLDYVLNRSLPWSRKSLEDVLVSACIECRRPTHKDKRSHLLFHYFSYVRLLCIIISVKNLSRDLRLDLLLMRRSCDLAIDFEGVMRVVSLCGHEAGGHSPRLDLKPHVIIDLLHLIVIYMRRLTQ